MHRIAAHAPAVTSRKSASHTERMLLVIAEHFRERLLPRDVAAAVVLDPDYAGSLTSRHRIGMGLSDYITECRVSHAKALLATTDAAVLDIALDSGFGSVSQFHAIFKLRDGCTPHAYRTSLRSGRNPTPRLMCVMPAVP